jgi:hypothetical protein
MSSGTVPVASAGARACNGGLEQNLTLGYDEKVLSQRVGVEAPEAEDDQLLKSIV